MHSAIADREVRSDRRNVRMFLKNPYGGYRADYLDEISSFKKRKKKPLAKIEFEGPLVKIRSNQIGKICLDDIREWMKYIIKLGVKQVLIRCVNLEQAKKLGNCLRQMRVRLTVEHQTNEFVFLQVS